MTGQKRALELMGGASEMAIDAGSAGVLNVVHNGDETVAFSKFSEGIDHDMVLLWMVGSLLKTIEETNHEQGGDLDARQFSADALSLVEGMPEGRDPDDVAEYLADQGYDVHKGV